MTPFLIAIMGGSGAGKSWLAEQLSRKLRGAATRLSLDDFYRDRSHLPRHRRVRINFDHPRAIDWAAFEKALRDCAAGRPTRIPQYDFATSTRLARTKVLRPKPFVLVDGLWLLRRPAVRRRFQLSIFIDCSTALRFRRRLTRDLASRGQDAATVKRQFRETVAPMHLVHVAPQSRYAHVVLKSPVKQDQVRALLVRCANGIRQTPY